MPESHPGSIPSAIDEDPVHLALLAPASRCNQSCPRCAITEVFREPVTSFDLGPADYGRFVGDFLGADVPVRSVMFLGYEPTLPESWPYVESTFQAATSARGDVSCSFITNGMLLHKRARRVEILDPAQITVSLDGSDPATHDPIRGLPGAFEVTVESVRRFLRDLPTFSDRLVIASCVYDEVNYRSLTALPRLLSRLGLSRWLLGVGLERRGDSVEHVPTAQAMRWLRGLAASAKAEAVETYFVDLPGDAFNELAGLQVVRPGGLASVFRLDPTGAIRTGDDLMRPYDSSSVRRWNPRHESAVEAAGYRQRSSTAATTASWTAQ